MNTSYGKKIMTTVAAVMLLFSCSTLMASSVTLPLKAFNVLGSTDFSGEIVVDLTGSVASFNFKTLTGNTNTVIQAIYFESGLGSLLSGGTLGAHSAGVSMFKDTGSNPTKVTPVVNSGFSGIPNTPWAGNLTAFGAYNPSPTSGINVGEYQTINFDYLGSGGISELVSAITNQDGNSRIMAHVQNCDGDESCKVSVVPIPATVWLLGPALAGVGLIGRRRKKQGMPA